MKIGLALSGGGIRGIAHAGALKAFEEQDIKIDIIGGTSSGSLIASLYAMGISPYYIYVLFKKYAEKLVSINAGPIISEIGNFLINKKISITGLKSGEGIEEAYNEIAYKKGISKISDIKMPIFIPAVDISNGKEYIFTSVKDKMSSKYITDISVGTAVRASSSFPVVFNSCNYNEHIFLDGGILNNIPIKEVKEHGADKVISIKFDSDPVKEDSNAMDIVMKILDVMGNKISEESFKLSDYTITIPSDGTGLLDTGNLDYCYKSGYNTVMKEMDKIKEMLGK